MRMRKKETERDVRSPSPVFLVLSPSLAVPSLSIRSSLSFPPTQGGIPKVEAALLYRALP